MKLTYVEVKITNGQSVSGEFDLRDRDLVGIVMPTAWTAAGLAFQCAGVAYDGARPGTKTAGGLDGVEPFQPVVDDTATAIALTVGASTYVCLRESMLIGLRGLARVKLVSGTNAIPVAQGADRAITLVCCGLP